MSWRIDRIVRSIGGRLVIALWAGVIVLMTTLFLLLDYGVDREIYGRLDAGLQARALTVAALFETHPSEVALGELYALMPEFRGGDHAGFMEIWDQQRHSLLASGGEDRHLSAPARMPLAEPVHYDLRLPDGHRGRAAAVRLTYRKEGRAVEAVLSVAEEREAIDELERRLHYALLLGVLVTAIACAALAIFAVRRGLRPLLAFGSAAAGEDVPPVLPPADDLPIELQPFAIALTGAFSRLGAVLERERSFARDVAHELRTPLAEIRTALELMRRVASDPASFDGALSSAVRMQGSIDALLSLSRYEAGIEKPVVEPLDLVSALRAATRRAQRLGAERGIRFDVRVPAEAWVVSDPVLLDRILDNLVINAASHSPPHSVVELEIFGASDPVLRVVNPAPQLTEADVARFGQRFWRKSPVAGSRGHAGLGVALARALADVLGVELRFRLEDRRLTAELAGLRPIAAADATPS